MNVRVSSTDIYISVVWTNGTELSIWEVYVKYFRPYGWSVHQWPGRSGLNPKLIHSKNSKKYLLNTWDYKVRIKDKVE